MTFEDIYNDYGIRKRIYFKTKNLYENSTLKYTMEHQDLEQLVMIKILKNIDNLPYYNHHLGYIYTCIRRVFLQQIELNNREKRDVKITLNSVKLDDIDNNSSLPISEVISNDINIEEDYNNKFDFSKYKFVFTTKRDKAIMKLLINGYTQSEIARALSMKPSNVTRRMNVFRERLN